MVIDDLLANGIPHDDTTVGYAELVRANVDDTRWSHCLGTAKLAVELAGSNDVSRARAAIAGLIHDIARPMSDEELLARLDPTDDISEIERRCPVLLHGLVGAKMVRAEMGCTDDELLFAVRHHTCGHPDFGPLGKCLMVADYAEANRDFPAVHAIRKRLNFGSEPTHDTLAARVTRTRQTAIVDEVLFQILENKIAYLHESGCEIEPVTFALRDTLSEQVRAKGD